MDNVTNVFGILQREGISTITSFDLPELVPLDNHTIPITTQNAR